MRKEKYVVIETEDRDKDKVFFVKEMDAFKGDAWAKRALLALSKVEFDGSVLGDIENLGWQGLAALGLQFLSGLRWEESKPLFDELMECVQFVPDPKKMNLKRPVGHGGAEDIEEIATIWHLQLEAFNLHANFSELAARLKSKIRSAMAAASLNTETSPAPSARSSRRGSQA